MYMLAHSQKHLDALLYADQTQESHMLESRDLCHAPSTKKFCPYVCMCLAVYHPNINLEGNVCLNILREDWKPVLDINAVIYGLIYLFYEPNPDDPLNHEVR